METPDRVRVMIVEDHEIARSGLLIVLNSFDDLEIVGEASDGREAISKCLECSPEVILMDIIMPKMNGIDATREIKSKAPQTRIIMFTTYSRDEDIFAAFASGADGYCLKEASAHQLYLAIQTVRTGAAWLDPSIADRVLKCHNSDTARSPRPNNMSPELAKGYLSPRELEVLNLVVEGLSNQQIAERLGVGNETVKTHMRHIMEKLQVADRTQAALKAVRAGLF
jgi:NarL family two-component system response regulator LiaR